MTVEISVLHATRKRPERAPKTREIWIKRATKPNRVEWLYGVDENDPTRHELERRVAATGGVVVVNRAEPSNVAASNACYRASSGAVIVQCSDDYYPPAGWDETVLGWLQAGDAPGGLARPLVLGTGDPICRFPSTAVYSGDGMLTMVCATRAYLQQVGGFMLYPEYDGIMADFDFTQKAAMDGVLIDAYEQVHFYHDWRGGKDDPDRDETYAEHMQTEKHTLGWEVWQRRCEDGLPDVDEHLNPKPPQDAARVAWAAENFRAARAAIEPVIKRLHKRICGGRFRFHFGIWLWNECTCALDDKAAIGIDEPLPF